MKHKITYKLALFSGILILAFAGCSDDDDNGGGATGPASSASFAGSSISFNPTINFLAGDTLTYLNSGEGVSDFPAAATATSGTYAYVPSANFKNGTFTFNVDGVTGPIVLEASGFQHNGSGNITGFTVRANGKTYPVTVTGDIPAYKAPSSGGSGGSGGLVNATTDIASAVQGTHELTFFNAFGGDQVAGSPHKAGDKVTIVIGARTLKVGAKTLSNPKNPTSMSDAFVYQDGNLWYWVYPTTPVGINLYGGANPTQAGTTFYGGFKAGAGGDNGNDDNGDNGGDGSGDTAGLPGSYSGVFKHQPSGTELPTGVPANGATVNFTVSADLKTLTFNGVNLPLGGGDGRPVSLTYTNAQSSPTNNLTVTLRLKDEGKTIFHFEGQYFQTGSGSIPIPRVLYFLAGDDSVTKK